MTRVFFFFFFLVERLVTGGGASEQHNNNICIHSYDMRPNSPGVVGWCEGAG